MVGIDPMLHSAAGFARLQSALATPPPTPTTNPSTVPLNITLLAVAANPVDAVWSVDSARPRPPPPSAQIRVHPLSVAGRAVVDKLAALRQSLSDQGAFGLLCSSLDEIM